MARSRSRASSGVATPARSAASTTRRRSGPSSRASTSSSHVRAGESGKLFGAITQADVASAIKKSGGPLVDKRSVEIGKPIKTTGKHTVGVKLHDAVTAHVAVAVTPQA